MDKTCNLFKDLNILYVNKTIDDKDKIALFQHLIQCQKCREDLALTLKVNKLILSNKKVLPDNTSIEIFALIQREEDLKKNNIFKPYLDSLSLVSRLLTTTRKSIRLALKFI